MDTSSFRVIQMPPFARITRPVKTSSLLEEVFTIVIPVELPVKHIGWTRNLCSSIICPLMLSITQAQSESKRSMYTLPLYILGYYAGGSAKKALDAHRPYDNHAVPNIILGDQCQGKRSESNILAGYAEGCAKESPRHSPALRIGGIIV